MAASDVRQPGDRPGAAAFPLSPQEREWLKLKWGKVRESAQTADLADRDWKRINNAINQRILATDNQRKASADPRGPLTPLERAKIKSDSLPLKDALDVGKWHSANAQRHIDDVNLFLRMKELGVL